MQTRRGSCLCGAVAFEVEGPIRGVGSCHCSKCRKVSGTGGNAELVVRSGRFRWRQGEEHRNRFQRPDGWGPMRCRTCGSPVPQSHDGGKSMWVQAGLMDDPLDTDIKLHIFCASRADGDRESPDAVSHDEAAK